MRALPTFGRWLRQQRTRQDPVGDLARDFISDSCGKRLSTFVSIHRHIEESHTPCVGALEAMERAYREWREIAKFP